VQSALGSVYSCRQLHSGLQIRHIDSYQLRQLGVTVDGSGFGAKDLI
jgi:hypothetical protein